MRETTANLMSQPLSRHDIQTWIEEQDESRLIMLWQAADAVRRRTVGDHVHLRGLIEVSNHCVRSCGYCGLRAGNTAIARYQMRDDEIMACVAKIVQEGVGTVVLQAGEDPGITRDGLADLVRRIKQTTDLAVTLSMGERCEQDLVAWREAGADRYLLKFETSDRHLYEQIHPTPSGNPDRLTTLQKLRSLGYEVGSGIMVGLPGQQYESLADDICLFRDMDLDMIGVGPYLPHPATPLGEAHARSASIASGQVPNSEGMTCAVMALTRLVRPDANIPATTALTALGGEAGRYRGLGCGANVVMTNFTPLPYRRLYSIYPGKTNADATGQVELQRLRQRLKKAGRPIGRGAGSRCRETLASTRNMNDPATRRTEYAREKTDRVMYR